MHMLFNKGAIRQYAMLFACALLSILLLAGDALTQARKIGESGLPVPRFVSLKSDRVNVRVGPSRDHRISWTYVKAGLPIEIIDEFENWRRIRDWQNEEGWIFGSLLSGRRTAIVVSSGSSEMPVPLYAQPDAESPHVALLHPRVLADIDECEDDWCNIVGDGFSGWIARSQLYGAYPDETIN